MQTLSLEEPLVMSTIVTCKKQFESVLQENDEPVNIDLSKVMDCDTSGVQLLISVFKFSQVEKRKVAFQDYSPAISQAFANMGIEDVHVFFTSEQ